MRGRYILGPILVFVLFIAPGWFYSLIDDGGLHWEPIWEFIDRHTGDDDDQAMKPCGNGVFVSAGLDCPDKGGTSGGNPGATATPVPNTGAGGGTGGSPSGGLMQIEHPMANDKDSASNMYGGNQLNLSSFAALGANELAYAHGDLKANAQCSFKIWKTGEKISGLSQSTWQLFIVKGGSEQERLNAAKNAQEAAARTAPGNVCPLVN